MPKRPNKTKAADTGKTEPTSFKPIWAKPNRCDCQGCPQCRPHLRFKQQARYLPTVEKFETPAMLTLKVSGTKFESPAVAFEYLTKDKVRKLAKALHVENTIGRHWLSATEFHKNGYPHFHVVVDCVSDSWLRIGARKHWKHGDTHLTTDTSAKSCLSYALKAHKNIVLPDYIRDHPKPPRLVNTSQGFLNVGATQT